MEIPVVVVADSRRLSSLRPVSAVKFVKILTQRFADVTSKFKNIGTPFKNI